jgi:membrane-associated protease RseP (regulator of RpoE activity)
VSSALAITIFIVGLLAAIMLHEWGHFASARKFGMRADRFFMGFGPTLWSRRWGETEFGVKAIPAGGFVRIQGMSPGDERLAPVADQIFDPEAVAADRRLTAERAGVDVMEVDALPDATWERMERILHDRGTPRTLRRRIVDRTSRNLHGDGGHAEAHAVLLEVLATEVRDTGRVGDLHHRLLRGDEGRFFHERPAWQRAIVLVAGSAMHFVIAIVLLFVGFLAFPQFTGDATTEVGALIEDTPAVEAGLQPGDRVIGVGTVMSDDFQVLREEIRSRPGIPTTILIERDGEQLTLPITPMADTDEETGEVVGLAGFQPVPESRRLSPGEALYETFIGPGSVPTLTVRSLGAIVQVFGPEGVGALFRQVGGDEDRGIDGGVSIVGAGAVTGQGVGLYGAFFLIGMLASVNIFVGIFNLLPLPPLDGGHLAVLGVERAVNGIRRLRGQPQTFSIDPRTVAAIAMPVIVLVGTVALALIWLDITNPISLN